MEIFYFQRVNGELTKEEDSLGDVCHRPRLRKNANLQK